MGNIMYKGGRTSIILSQEQDKYKEVNKLVKNRVSKQQKKGIGGK